MHSALGCVLGLLWSFKITFRAWIDFSGLSAPRRRVYVWERTVQLLQKVSRNGRICSAYCKGGGPITAVRMNRINVREMWWFVSIECHMHDGPRFRIYLFHDEISIAERTWKQKSRRLTYKNKSFLSKESCGHILQEYSMRIVLLQRTA